MKKVLIAALLCVNVALVSMLVAQWPLSKAHAQLKGGTDYIAVTGRVDQFLDVLYVLDLAKKKMVGYKFDLTSKKMMVSQSGRDLTKDFGTKIH